MAELTSELTPDQRDAYAAPGSLPRNALDVGLVTWPDRAQAAYELAVLDYLAGGQGTFGLDGVTVTIAAEHHLEDCPECRQGKHGNCTGWSLDTNTDELVECPCAEGGHL